MKDFLGNELDVGDNVAVVHPFLNYLVDGVVHQKGVDHVEIMYMENSKPFHRLFYEGKFLMKVFDE